MGEIRKFTSEDLMKAMGLQVGDRVKVTYVDNNFTATDEIYEVVERDNSIWITAPSNEYLIGCEIECMLNKNYEILPRPKRVGDLKCDTIGGCDHCPLSFLVGCYAIELDTLYSNLKQLCDMHNDQEIYDLLKSRLDKVVE